MSHRGTSLVPVDPYGIGVGPHARFRLSLRGLGEEADYGIEARQASLDRNRRDRIDRMYQQQDAARREAEREKALKITQEAVLKARGTQVDILTAGQNQFRRLLVAGSGVAIFALGAITISAALRGRKRSGSHSSSGKRRKSRKSRARKSFSPRSVKRAASWRPTWKPRSVATSPQIGVAS